MNTHRSHLLGIVAFVAYGCAPTTPLRLDDAAHLALRDLGIAEAVEIAPNSFSLLDAEGRELGSALLRSDDEVSVELLGSESTLAMDGSSVRATCGDRMLSFDVGVEPSEELPLSVSCLDALEVAHIIVDGVSSPAETVAVSIEALADCHTTTTWVFGGCSRCYRNLPGYVATAPADVNQWCSAGAVYSTCGRTVCAEQIETLPEH